MFNNTNFDPSTERHDDDGKKEQAQEDYHERNNNDRPKMWSELFKTTSTATPADFVAAAKVVK